MLSSGELLVLLGVLSAWAVFHLWYGATHTLISDEAYYWVWSRRLAPGYLDHPPVVAILIWLSTAIFGDTELGVRFFPVVMTVGTIAALVWISLCLEKGTSSGTLDANKRRLRPFWWVLILLLVWPQMNTMSTVLTPDPPSCFFSALALVAAHRAVTQGRGVWWLVFGLLTGLALLSKFTSVLVPGGIFLALLSSAEGRRHLSKGWFWSAAVTAAVVFSPVIYWNATHDWAGIRFQLHHGLGEVSSGLAEKLGSYVFLQAVVATPVLFAVYLWVLVYYWRRYAQLGAARQMLLWSATLPLVFFCLAALRRPGEANWPVFGYLPLSVLAASRLAEGGRIYVVALRTGVAVSLIAAIALHRPQELGALVYRVTGKGSVLDELVGWRELAAHVEEQKGDAYVVANTYQVASMLSFYLEGQPEIWAMNIGSRSNMYDYWESRPDLSAYPRVLFVGAPRDEGVLAQWFDETHAREVECRVNGRVVRRLLLVEGTNLGVPGAAAATQAHAVDAAGEAE